MLTLRTRFDAVTIYTALAVNSNLPAKLLREECGLRR